MGSVCLCMFVVDYRYLYTLALICMQSGGTPPRQSTQPAEFASRLICLGPDREVWVNLTKTVSTSLKNPGSKKDFMASWFEAAPPAVRDEYRSLFAHHDRLTLVGFDDDNETAHMRARDGTFVIFDMLTHTYHRMPHPTASGFGAAQTNTAFSLSRSSRRPNILAAGHVLVQIHDTIFGRAAMYCSFAEWAHRGIRTRRSPAIERYAHRQFLALHAK